MKIEKPPPTVMFSEWSLSVANISEVCTYSLPIGVFCFSHILLTTFSACEDIHEVGSFTFNFLSNSVFLPCDVAGDLFYPI